MSMSQISASMAETPQLPSRTEYMNPQISRPKFGELKAPKLRHERSKQSYNTVSHQEILLVGYCTPCLSQESSTKHQRFILYFQCWALFLAVYVSAFNM